MMNNVTNEILSTNNFFRRYFLGESIRNIFIRLTVILSAIIIVWSGIMFALIIHMKCQRTKRMLKTTNTHHHLYDSNTSLNKKRTNCSKRTRRFNSSSSSLTSTRCYSIRHVLSQLKQRCLFWPSTTTHENSIVRSSSFRKRKQPIETLPKTPPSTPNKVQLVVQSMTRRSFISNPNKVRIGKKISLYHEADSSSGDELKNLHSIQEDLKSPIEINSNTSNTIQLTESNSYIPHLSISETKDNYPTTKRLQKLHDFNTKATRFFHPISRRLSNTNTNSCLPPTNTIEKQQQRKPLSMVASARELTADHEWKWQHSLIDDLAITDGSQTSSSRHIPLVMITDTSSSNTNIVELETFEDKHRLMGDIERRLSKELRASYRPRHST